VLSKRICKKCYKHFGKEWDSEAEYEWKGMEYGAHVHCPHDYTFFVLLRDNPPKECHYYLEHLMETQNEAQLAATHRC